MATPSFDELLQQARAIGEQRAEDRYPSTGELAAKGVSQFVSTLLGAPVTERRTTGGYLSPRGELTPLARPHTSGGNLLQTLSQHFINGPESSPVPQGSVGLTPDQTSDFAIKSSFNAQKYDAMAGIANIRAKAMLKAAGQRIRTTTQPMIKEASDYVWALIGRDPQTELNLPILTYGDADRVLRTKGIDTNSELKSLGYDIALNKDPLFGVPPKERDRIQNELDDKGNGAGNPFKPSKNNFKTVKEAEAAKLPSGTIVTIGGRRARIK